MIFNLSRQGIYRFTLILAILVLLIMSFISFRKIQNLNDFSSRIQHVLEVQKTLEKTYSTIKDAESGHRGFILTRDSSHLTIFKESLLRIESQKFILDSILVDNTIQRQRCDTFFQLIRERTAIMNRVLSGTMAPQYIQDNNRLLDLLASGKQKMDSIRAVIDRMQETESVILLNNSREKKRLAAITPWSLLLLSCVAITLLILCYYEMIHTLRKRIEFEKELARKIEELNRSNTDLEQFAYVASHDLQEPLRKIMSFGDRLMLKQKENLDEDGISMIAKIQNAAGRMQTLINDLLGFSRLVNVVDKMELVNMNTILQEVLNDMEVEISTRTARININELPVLNAIPSLIRQLFQNLISNGLKFAQRGVTPQINITSRLLKESEVEKIFILNPAYTYYQIEVTDNGIGFDEKYLDKIFIIFQRLHGKLEYDGTGIGLAVCKKIMNIHQGFITGKSVQGQGATFILHFPIQTVSKIK